MNRPAEESLRDTVEKVVRGLSLELVDFEISGQRGRRVLRVSVDRPGGVTVDECAKANELLGSAIDRENAIEGPFVLEVMSPGLNRPLKKKEDYERSLGKRVTVKLSQPFEGKSAFTGVLLSAGDGYFTLECGVEKLEFDYEAVVSARLNPELPW